MGLAAGAEAGTVVFLEPGFPAVESEAPSRETLAAALAPLDPTFVGIEDLRKPETLRGADLLVLPYGSAFPADAWGAIRAYLERGGNLLNLGGRPLWIPAFREGTGFRLARRGTATGGSSRPWTRPRGRVLASVRPGCGREEERRGDGRERRGEHRLRRLALRHEQLLRLGVWFSQSSTQVSVVKPVSVFPKVKPTKLPVTISMSPSPSKSPRSRVTWLGMSFFEGVEPELPRPHLLDPPRRR